jgi:phospholipid/cholesterol/gamma-HCH transport system substrate-binding protein
MQAAIRESRITLQKAGQAADQLTLMAGSANKLLDTEGKPLMGELRRTLASANGSLSALEKTLNAANPAIDTLNSQTLPEVTQLARDLRQLSGSLKSVTQRLDQDGVSSLVSAPALPDYEPGGAKQK